MKIRPETAHPVPRNIRTSCMVITAFVLALFYSVPVLADASAANASQPLTLDECVDIALSKNPEIAQARYVRDKARFYTHEARAGYFPEVNLNSSAGYQSETMVTRQDPIILQTGEGATPFVIPGREIQIGDDATADFSLSVYQPLYTGGVVKAEVAAARAGLESADLQVKLVRRDVRRQVITAFYNLAVARELEKIAQASVVRLNSHLEDAQNLLETGMILKAELLTIRMRKLDSDLAVVEAGNAVARARAALARSMGQDMATALEIPVNIVVDWENPPPWPIPMAFTMPRTRQEQQVIDRRMAAADARARAAHGSRLPRVGMTASAHYGWPGFVGNDPDWDAWWQAGVSATWTLFDMNRRSSREQAARAETQQLAKAGQALDDRIGQERITARLAYEEACCRQDIMAEKVTTARENYQTRKDHFKEGIATNTDYLDAHTDLQSAEGDLAAARARVRVAWSDYLIAMGLNVESADAPADKLTNEAADKTDIPSDTYTIGETTP